MEHHLIDNELDTPQKHITLDILQWWEKKRLLFNLIIGSVGALTVIILAISDPSTINRLFGVSFIIQSIFYLVFINACYCAGWGVRLLGYYYFKITFDTKAADYTLFFLGTGFTALVTFIGYVLYMT